MPSRSIAVLAAATALALFAPSAVTAQDKVGVVTTLHGTATVARATLPQPAPLKFRDAVFVNDRIATGEQSIARILLGGRAIVTVRERSILSINEVPGGVSTVDLGIGGIALAVVKERMKPGESIEIRTPNAVAGIRGTVVVADVSPVAGSTAQGPEAVTTTLTVLTGAIVFGTRDPLAGTVGTSVNLTAMQQSLVTGRSAPRAPVTLPPQQLRSLSTEYKLPVKDAPPVANEPLIRAQIAPAMDLAARLLESASTKDAGKLDGKDTGKADVKDASSDAGKSTAGGGSTTPTLNGAPKLGATTPTVTLPTTSAAGGGAAQLLLKPNTLRIPTVDDLRSHGATATKKLPLP